MEREPRSRFFQPSLRFGAEPAIVAADMVIDDMIGVTVSAVENSPAKNASGARKLTINAS